MLRIPKIFHRIWVGDKPLPEEFIKFGDTWQEHHPDWHMALWTSPKQIVSRNLDCVPMARNASQLSDIMRYEILYAFGGIYLDTDFICQKNVEALLSDASFVGAGEKPDMLSAGFIAAVPEHRIVKKAIDLIPERIKSDMHQAKSTGPGLITDAWQPSKDDPDVLAYGPELFYPYAWNEPHRRHEQFPEAYAVHHWSGSWLEKPHA